MAAERCAQCGVDGRTGLHPLCHTRARGRAFCSAVMLRQNASNSARRSFAPATAMKRASPDSFGSSRSHRENAVTPLSISSSCGAHTHAWSGINVRGSGSRQAWEGGQQQLPGMGRRAATAARHGKAGSNSRQA
eukprot:362704-Chlamydomonas_euryale.AAC.4